MAYPGLVGADPDEVDAFAHRLSAAAERIDDVRMILSRYLARTFWEGPEAADFRADWQRHHATVLAAATAALRKAATRAHHNAAEQRGVSRADGGGWGGGAIVGGAVGVAPAVGVSPAQVMQWWSGLTSSEQQSLIAQPPAMIMQAMLSAVGLAGLTATGGGPPHPGSAFGDWRDGPREAGYREPDRQDGRRMRADEVFGRDEGGAGSSHFDNDWAGRTILEHYLVGGDDWKIINDPDWSAYMMGNTSLSQQLFTEVQNEAITALDAYRAGGDPHASHNLTFPMEIENGEGIVGYQYLHQTNPDVGDFGVRGSTMVTARPDGGYEVTVHNSYTWNDIIDPNYEYSTDRWKNSIAEFITLGQADPYNIHITWSAATTVVFDSSGNVIEVRGYPAP